MNENPIPLSDIVNNLQIEENGTTLVRINISAVENHNGKIPKLPKGVEFPIHIDKNELPADMIDALDNNIEIGFVWRYHKENDSFKFELYRKDIYLKEIAKKED